MSVWKSDEKLLIFASLISSSKIILFEKQNQAFETVFHHEMKHFEVRQKYTARSPIVWNMRGNLHLNRYILKSYTTTKNTMNDFPVM